MNLKPLYLATALAATPAQAYELAPVPFMDGKPTSRSCVEADLADVAIDGLELGLQQRQDRLDGIRADLANPGLPLSDFSRMTLEAETTSLEVQIDEERKAISEKTLERDQALQGCEAQWGERL